MTSDDTALVQALRLHAYELVNGGTNASQLQRDLRAAASRLEALATRVEVYEQAKVEIRGLLKILPRPWIDATIGRRGTVTFSEWDTALARIDNLLPDPPKVTP